MNINKEFLDLKEFKRLEKKLKKDFNPIKDYKIYTEKLLKK